MPTKPTTQAGHRAALHPRLLRATEAGLAGYARLYPNRPQPAYISTWRPQLNCRTVSGACADASLHSLAGGVSRAADIDSSTWSKTADPQGHAADLARLIRQADPCIRWGASYRDFPHFDLPAVCAAAATAETAALTAAAGVPHAVAQAVDALAARMGVPAWTLYLGGGVALASLLASASNRL